MYNATIFIVEPDNDIREMLRVFLSDKFSDVKAFSSPEAVLPVLENQLPQGIITEVDFPNGMSGLDFIKQLRTTTRTSYIPVLFASHRTEREDMITGLELGADDYISKPINAEEFVLRIVNATELRFDGHPQVDHVSGLSTGKMIENQLCELMKGKSTWTYCDIKIRNFAAFTEVYSWQAGDEVIRVTSLMIAEVLDDTGTTDDFIGRPGRDNFILITHVKDPEALLNQIQERFIESVKPHYKPEDLERGHMLLDDEQKELMSLSVGWMSSWEHEIIDIRRITELAFNHRRQRLGLPPILRDDDDDGGLLTAW